MTTTQEQKEEPITFEQIREMLREITRSQKETDRSLKETDRIVKENARQLGGMTKSDGEAAEEHFVTSLASKMTFAGQHYDAIDRNVQRKAGNLQGEYDIVLSNGASVALIEVKNRATTAHLEKLLTKKLPDFRTLFPHYRNHTIYLGIGSMSFDTRVLEKAHELGIGILRQKGDTIEDDTSHIRAW